MAVETLRMDFQAGEAFAEISYDTVSLSVTQVRYANDTSSPPMKADITVAQAGKPTFQHTVLPGDGVPNPVVQAVPAGRYTVSPDPNDATGFVPNFRVDVGFHA